METITKLAQAFGSGNAGNDALLIAIAVAGVLIFGLLGWLGRSRGPSANEFERRFATITHKLEKLEVELASRKTEQVRNYEIMRSEYEFLREELREIKIHTGIVPELGAAPARRPSAIVMTTPEDVPLDATEDSFIRPAEAVRRSIQDSDNVRVQKFTNEKSLAKQLTKTRQGLFSKIRNFFGPSFNFDARKLEDLEATLIGADLGVQTVERLIEELRSEMSHGRMFDEDELIKKIKTKILTLLEEQITELRPLKRPDGPVVILVVGVNGVGKTTSCAKLAARWKSEGKNVLLVAADTFRAAATEQLSEWGNRVGVEVVSGPDGSKPQSVVFDGMKKAKAGQYDVVIVDTAGRLHNKANLMQELSGVKTTIEKFYEGAPHEVFLVVDGATGQNALNQAREFHSATPVTGLIITKLDGTAKGGIVVAIREELAIPVRFIGVGEAQEDLRPFVGQEFVDALFDDRELDSKQVDITEEALRVDAEPVSAHGAIRRRRRE